MNSAIEILKKIFETNKSVMFEDEKEALKKGILALEQKEKLKEWLDDKEAKLKDIKNKGWSLEQLAGKQILINEIRKKLEEGVEK